MRTAARHTARAVSNDFRRDLFGSLRSHGYDNRSGKHGPQWPTREASAMPRVSDDGVRSQQGAARDVSPNIRYTADMTRTLDAAIAKLAALPPEEQDRVGRWLLEELADEEQWARTFDASQDVLSKLAAEARADRTGGRTTDVDPDSL